MDAAQLCPGYKHVQSFGPDDEYESDEEVEYITLDLGAVEPALLPSSSSYMLIGLDTPTPFLQLSGTVLKGRHDTLLGTELLFAENSTNRQDRSKRSVHPICTTEKRIQFKQVQLVPKSPGNKKGKESGQISGSSYRKSVPDVDHLTGKVAPAGRYGQAIDMSVREDDEGESDGGARKRTRTDGGESQQ